MIIYQVLKISSCSFYYVDLIYRNENYVYQKVTENT